MAVRSHWYEIGIRLGVVKMPPPPPRNLAAHLIHVFSLWRKREQKATIAILLEACRQASVVACIRESSEEGTKSKVKLDGITYTQRLEFQLSFLHFSIVSRMMSLTQGFPNCC